MLRITSYNVCYTKLLRLSVIVVFSICLWSEKILIIISPEAINTQQICGKLWHSNYGSEPNGIAFLEDIEAVAQPRGFLIGQIGLRDISGDHRARAEADAGQEHLVITSYSIHYTKLYEVVVPVLRRP